MRFLITGTAGFIGFHLARRVLSAGHAVTGFDGLTDYYDVRLKHARLDRLCAMEGYRHVAGRLEDRAALEGAADAPPDVIVHLAAQAGVRYSREAPRTFVESNLLGSCNVLELARKQPPKHLLIASTSSIYGASERLPFSESDCSNEPLSLYAATKKGMEVMAHSYAYMFQIPTTVLRFFTVYGPWGRPDMALFRFVKAIRQGHSIDVYGGGDMARDFTFIDDVVEALGRLVSIAPAEANRVPGESARDTLSPTAPFRIINVANGTPIRLMDFISVIERRLGRTAGLNLTEMQRGDVPQTFGDISLLRALTGFTPTVHIEEGVSAFVDWYLDYHR
ncbi:NAD-dependent epimerase/dehydratase family protein [Altericroceibacterium xinjiangense]|uniref:NAD-dependent epimerase/dehydratase family protein n=1 Tax=Altericroceibacterium xinjiangense TaxID=762261 RepID=UPI000F7E7DD3|nr:NAD-dependent epimerase/dehydratase family protein [Altericroceibacterium xinjiangense]